MIIGIGQDLVSITRIEEIRARFGARFLDRLYTPVEQKKAATRVKAAATLAKRFAAKEACAKALGTGMSQGVAWKQIGVVNDAAGKPMLELTGAARAKAESMVPRGMRPVLHLSLTDEGTEAQALVIFSAEPQ